MTKGVRPDRLFSHLPTVEFVPETTRCGCGGELLVRKTKSRVVATMEIGAFRAHERILKCESCGSRERSGKLQELVPYRGKFGFNVLEYVGRELFVHCRGEREIQRQLKDRNIDISRSEIGYLGKKFIVYLALLHRESRANLKELMTARGGYVLHLDATCEGGSPHLFSALDEVAELVLGNVKLPSEKAEHILPFLIDLKKAFGEPLAVVRDMGTAIEAAVNKVFPGVKNFICHFHFLRDIGKDLFGGEYDTLRKMLKSYALTTSLRNLSKRIKNKIHKCPELTASLEAYTKTSNQGVPSEALPISVIVYTLCLWILDAHREASGYGFPFDRVHLSTYRRLLAVREVLSPLKARGGKDKHLFQLQTIVSQITHDRALKRIIAKLEEKVEVFDQLREALRITDPENTKSLNDDGDDVSMRTIKQQVTQWKATVNLTQRAASELAYKRVLTQLNKHWDRLFAEPITVINKKGTFVIQPQRTNNILERLFRDVKRTYRKRTGSHKLSRTLKAMLAEVPLVKNLANQEYLDILLQGKNSLAERFADIDAQLVEQYIKQQRLHEDRIAPKLAKVIRFPDLPNKILLNRNSRACA